MTAQFHLQRVDAIPRSLEEGRLYVSERFRTASHLCACGCGSRVVTPLGPAGWHLNIRDGRPSLHPSIGNWALPCKSHYIIAGGRVVWAPQWSENEILAGRRADQADRIAHVESEQNPQSLGALIAEGVERLLAFFRASR